MTRPSNSSFPSRRQFLVGSAATTLSAAGVAMLAGDPTLAAAKGESLYERLGGYNGISAVVDVFADSLFADKRINEFFIGMSDDTRAQFKQKEQESIVQCDRRTV